MMDFIAGIIGLFISFTVFSFGLMLCLAAYALTSIGLMRMSQKAGVEGYKAWIPFYRDYLLCRISMGAGWYFILGYIPVVSVLMRAVYAYEVMLSYGESFLYGILYFFFPVIGQLVAGFGGARYQGSQDLAQQVRDMFGGSSGYHAPGSYGKDRDQSSDYTSYTMSDADDGKEAGGTDAGKNEEKKE